MEMANISEIISSYLRSEVARGSFPGAQYVIGEDQQIVAEDALGCALVEPERVPATLDTIYDLASLTKPLVTALLLMSFAERGLLDLKAPLARYLNEFDDDDKREVTLTKLLTHTSGLPNWRPLYLEAQTRAQVPSVIARILLEPNPQHGGRGVTYSDLNYILLAFVLERVTGERLDHLAKREIFDPLGLKRTMFNPPAALRREIAATEHGQTFELANAVADVTARRRLMGLDTPTRFAAEDHEASLLELTVTGSPGVSSSFSSRYQWRKHLIWGEVHDGNAYFMGGVAGHAGLFSTAREAFRLANQFLPGSELLKPESLDLFSDNLTRGCATSRSIAWILAETLECSAGSALPPTAFGHNGFTGTSIWMDPEKRRVFVLLTNRVHPRVDAVDMKEKRRRFNALAVETTNQKLETGNL
ncbi:MAG: serine hydrolase domain-containing protein [Acidobacteriota bacterium]